MSKTSSGGIGIGTIIFWIFIGYLIFGGDDNNDKKEVDIKVNDTNIIEDVQKTVSKVRKELTEIKVEEIPIYEEEEEEEEVITEKKTEPEETEKEAELKSLEEEIGDDTKLKKL